MNLFDIIEEDENKELAELIKDDQFRQNLQQNCPHISEEMNETDWGPPWGIRMTWICKRCKHIRGRC